uniref:Uncharacterized protein n=1 Tax=Ditylenchus dipsaci TaxID=166011 RepID=A0A915CY01_9BILA
MLTTSSNPWVIVHIFDNDKSALLWSPSTQQSRCLQADQISGQDLKLGNWLCISQKTGGINLTDSTCSFRVINGTLQIKAPVVFFSSSKLAKDLGFAPGFGRVICFAKEMTLEKDQIYMAWITYNKYSTDKHLQCQMTKYSVEWVVESQPSVPISKSEIDVFLQANSLNGMQSVTGIVVSKDNETGTGSIYNPKHGECDYQLTNKTAFNVGSFVHFIPMKNFFGWTTPLNISEATWVAQGISLFSCEPDLILSINNWEHDAEKGVIDVPNWDLQLHLAKNMPEDCEKLQEYDYSQPISVVYDNETERFTLFNGIPIILSQEKATEVLFDVEEHLNFFTPLTLGPKLVKENTDELGRKDCRITKEAVQKQNYKTDNIKYFETDAVVVYTRLHDVILFALEADPKYRKFAVDKARFKEDPHMGDWFRVSLPEQEVIAKLVKPTLKTVTLNSQLIRLYTRIKVVEAFVNEDDPNEICGYSDDLGPIIDNENCLKKSQLGKTIDVWVLSNAPTNGAHWRIFSEKLRSTTADPQRSIQQKVNERSISSRSTNQKCSTFGEKENEELVDASGRALIDVDRGPPTCFYDVLQSEEKSLKIGENRSTKNRTTDLQSDDSFKVTAKVVECEEEYAEKGAENIINATRPHISHEHKNKTDRLVSPKHNGEIKVNAIVTYVSLTHVTFYAVQSKLTNPSIKVEIAEFANNEKPSMGDWYYLTMDFETDYRNISGVPLLDPVLPTRVDRGNFLSVRTKVMIRRLPKIASMSSSFCGYSEDVGRIVDNTECLQPHQAHKIIDVWVQNCKPRDGSSWCIFNERLHRK